MMYVTSTFSQPSSSSNPSGAEPTLLILCNILQIVLDFRFHRKRQQESIAQKLEMDERRRAFRERDSEFVKLRYQVQRA